MRLNGTKTIIIKSRWYRELCERQEDPQFQQVIADRTEIDRRNVSSTLSGHIISKSFQEKIAEEVNIPVGKLFGPNAWFCIAARKLQERREECLAACSG